MSIVYTDKTGMPFGKYKGRSLANVPADYLLWLYEGDLNDGPLRRYISENLDAIRAEAEKRRNNNAILRAMYR